MEERKKKREYCQKEVRENAEGLLIVETTYPDRTAEISLPIIKIRRPVFYIFNDTLNFAIIDSPDLDSRILIGSESISPKGISTSLAKKGVPLLCNSRNKKEYEMLLFEYFLETAQNEKIAEFPGWNHVDDRWFFAEDYYSTVAGMKGE